MNNPSKFKFANFIDSPRKHYGESEMTTTYIMLLLSLNSD